MFKFTRLDIYRLNPFNLDIKVVYLSFYNIKIIFTIYNLV